MRRRELVHAAILAAVASGLQFPARLSPLARADDAGVQRVRPSDPGWPSAEAWQQLNRNVGGHLIRVRPLLGACANDPAGPACQALIQDLHNPYYIGDQAAGTMSSGWVDAWTPQPSVYAVAASSVDDVVAAVNFARDHNLRLVVKGGGHSYQGTSNAADSLLIWTRSMNDIVLHDDFIPQGCEVARDSQPAVTVGAGAVWMHVYDAVTTKAGRYVQGGGCATVGVAGLVQSGGFGSFSKAYGTAAAGLLEAEIVTADGVVRTANACSNPDLFWGLKGGGGGSLGVVTRLTLRTRELPATFGGVNATITAASDDAFRRLIGTFVRFYTDNLLNQFWGESVTFGVNNTLTVKLVFQRLERDEAGGVWAPFFDWLTGSTDDFTVTQPIAIQSLPAQDWWNVAFFLKYAPSHLLVDPRPGAPQNNAWFPEESRELQMFIHGYESAWLPASLLQRHHQRRLSDALFATSRYWDVSLHFNKGLAGANAEDVAAARDTATHPDVLTAFALAIIGGGGPPPNARAPGGGGDLSAARDNAQAIGNAMAELRTVVPDAGAYVAESNFFTENWQAAYWGPNYPRLRTVKAAYDPDGLFFVHHGVGSEDWSDDGFTRSQPPG